MRKAGAFCDRLRNNGARRLIVINFGVGGNPRRAGATHRAARPSS